MALQYITDKNVNFGSREVFESEFIPGAEMVEVQGNPSVIGFKGFGTAITGSSCYLLSKMDGEVRKKFLESIYSSDGIGLSVGRITIGASDYSAELYSYDDTPFDTELKDFSVARDEKYIIPMIKEILEVKPDLYIFASPWSPPGWMKTGGSICGGYMREEFIECYAEYIVKFIMAYREYGINISAITPQNEPETQQNGCMPACVWHPEIEAKYIKILRKKLDEKKLDVKIWMHDHNFNGTDRVLWELENTEGLRQCCAGAAFHYYMGNIEETVKIREKYPRLELHFTEGGPRLYDNYADDWCKWGMMVSKALSCGYKSFTGWNLLLDENGAPNIGPFFCGGLATINSISGELIFSGQYKAFRHIASYMDSNSKIYPLTSDKKRAIFNYPNDDMPAEGFMIDNGDDKPIFVLVNPVKGKKQVQLSAKGKMWYIELVPESISTVVI
ncbi:MAG: hypothetical protein ACI4DY_07320 [Monoglobaceae bacterium]